jgi:hypothetical protein
MDTLKSTFNPRTGKRVYEGYNTARICENGHVITHYAETDGKVEDYCTKCGSKTVTACEHCQQKIRGHLHKSGSLDYSENPISKFCHECGKPYPWTEKGMKAARDLISEEEKLSPEEKETLSKSLDDIVCGTPSTQTAVIRLKKFLPKAGKEVADAVWSIVVDYRE